MAEEEDTGVLTMILTMEPVPMDHTMVHLTLPMEAMGAMEVDMAVSVCVCVLWVGGCVVCVCVCVRVCVRACVFTCYSNDKPLNILHYLLGSSCVS